MRTRRFLLSAVLILSGVCSHLVAQIPSTLEGMRLYKHVEYLASDSCTGRAPGTRGIENAAAYIIEQLKTFQVQPAGRDGYRDTFRLTSGVTLGADNAVTYEVRIERPGIPLDQVKPTKLGWKVGVDYQPWGFSESGTATGDVVFAGYGLSAASYDDYASVDVKGKVVVLLRGVPKWAAKDPAFSQQSSVRAKATRARDKGAVAVIFVNERGDSADVLARFGLDRLGKNSGILALQARRSSCAKIFPPKGTSLFVAETEIEKTKKPMSFVLENTRATVTTSLVFTESITSNIIGMIPGSDPSLSGEYVVIGAHYDHLGMGDENSLAASTAPAIHHGADDNASGTAGMLELASRFSEKPTRRSILVMGFSGEEKGLLGSKHWVSSPTVPLKNIAAMINLDMIGRLTKQKLNIQGVGTSPVWPALIDSAKVGTQFTISTTADGFGPSDHSSFTAKSIPVLFFFTGLHSDYHRPTDTYDKINADGQASIVSMVENIVRRVADAPTRPEFTQGADKQASTQSSSIALKVSFGVVPDYSDDPQGLRITGVKANSAAEKAGLKGEDIITKMGSTTIKNIYDLMTALGAFKPGDTTEVTVLRNDKPVTMKVTFGGK